MWSIGFFNLCASERQMVIDHPKVNRPVSCERPPSQVAKVAPPHPHPGWSSLPGGSKGLQGKGPPIFRGRKDTSDQACRRIERSNLNPSESRKKKETREFPTSTASLLHRLNLLNSWASCAISWRRALLTRSRPVGAQLTVLT